MKNNGSVTTIVVLMWAYRAKDIIYGYNCLLLSTAMYLMSTDYTTSTKFPYLCRGGGGGAILLTEKCDIVYHYVVSTSCVWLSGYFNIMDIVSGVSEMRDCDSPICGLLNNMELKSTIRCPNDPK